MDDEELKRLLNLNESDYLDFKEKWYEENGELIFDIICLCNSLSENKERYLVIGIKDQTKEYCDVNNDKNKKTAEDIINLLRGYLNEVPKIEVFEQTIENNEINIIKITPFLEHLPYVIEKPYTKGTSNGMPKILKHVIYSRDGSNNTPKNEGANISKIKKMFLYRIGVQYTPKEKFDIFIKDINNWDKDNKGIIYCKKDLNLKMIVNDGEHFKFQNINGYNELLRDTYLSEEFWNSRYNKSYNFINSGEEYYSEVKIDIYFKDINFVSFNLLKILIKGYPITTCHELHTFYFPRSLIDYDKTNLIESIKNSNEYKICQLLHFLCKDNCNKKCENCNINKYENGNDLYFEWLNRDYLKEPHKIYLKYLE